MNFRMEQPSVFVFQGNRSMGTFWMVRVTLVDPSECANLGV